jgi:hypothetical protein
MEQPACHDRNDNQNNDLIQRLYFAAGKNRLSRATRADRIELNN